MDRRSFLTGIATAALSASGKCANGPPDIAADRDREPDGSAEHEPKYDVPTRAPFRIGVESVLPGEGWWATIYGRFLGATYDEDMWVRALAELGAGFTLFYDSLAPQKPGACERIADMCQRHGMDFLFNNTYGDIYGPWLPDTGRAEYTDAQLAHAAETTRFRGIVLDEVEHRQIHHIDCGPGPYLADVQGKDLGQCYEALLKNVASIAERYRMKLPAVRVGFSCATSWHQMPRASSSAPILVRPTRSVIGSVRRP